MPPDFHPKALKKKKREEREKGGRGKIPSFPASYPTT